MERPRPYPEIVVEPKAGSEPLYGSALPLSATLLDFWRWSASDLVSNATRGVLAEFIVAQALGVSHGIRAEWDAYDLVTDSGLRVELKSAAYLQSWSQRGLSRISFDVRPTRAWSAGTNEMAAERRRQAGMYVFCLLAHKEQATLDPLDLRQWEFYVLPSTVLDAECPGQRRIGLAGLLRLSPTKTGFD